MKILIVAQYFPPDITAAAFRMYDTARLLEAAGHEVRVITAHPHRSQANGESAAEYDAQISGVWRARLASLNGGGFFDYIKHYSSFMVASTWLGLRHLGRRWKPDVIWASSPPLFVGLSGVALSRWLRIPLVMDIRDIWPASAVGTGRMSAQGRAYRFAESVERYVYNRATHITCVARPMQEYIRTRTQTPVTVVYNGARASDIVAQCGNSGSLENGHTLLYAGNLGRAQQLDLVIRAWAKVHGANGHCVWNMKLLGAGAMAKELKELAANLGVGESVVFAPPVCRQEAMEETTRAAALCVSLQPSKVFERTIPSKLFDYMAAGRPILGGVAGEGREILESTGANVCYEPGNQESLEHGLERLMRDYDHLRDTAQRNPAVIRCAYTREKAVAVLDGVFGSVVSNGGRRSAPRAEDQAGCATGVEPHNTRSGGDRVRELAGSRAEAPAYSPASQSST